MKVAILTGYDPQRRALLDFVNRNEAELSSLDVHVANVDAYQGQEADVAIFNVTRSNETGQLGFLQHEARINVALSRAATAWSSLETPHSLGRARQSGIPYGRSWTISSATPTGAA